MTMDIQIYDLRVSFIWVETFLDLLEASPSPDAPLAFLGSRYKYQTKFGEILGSGIEPEGLELPWLRSSKQRFWSHYLGCDIPGPVSGKRAWEALVPFRGEVPLAVEAPDLPGRLVLEAFFYPHAFALVITMVCDVNLSLAEMIDKALKIRRTDKYHTKRKEDKSFKPGSLDALSKRGRGALYKTVLGSEISPRPFNGEMFSVAAIVRGSGVDPDTPPAQDSEIHKTLEALATWRDTWKHYTLPKLDEKKISIEEAVPQGHVLYGRRRGRAVWFPKHFIQKAGEIHSLACYHRNLVFLSMQVESLSRLIAETTKQRGEGKPLSASHRECARRAAGILGRLYGGVETYRSHSPRAQIEQNDLVAKVNEVRDYFNMPPLS